MTRIVASTGQTRLLLSSGFSSARMCVPASLTFLSRAMYDGAYEETGDSIDRTMDLAARKNGHFRKSEGIGRTQAIGVHHASDFFGFKRPELMQIGPLGGQDAREQAGRKLTSLLKTGSMVSNTDPAGMPPAGQPPAGVVISRVEGRSGHAMAIARVENNGEQKWCFFNSAGYNTSGKAYIKLAAIPDGIDALVRNLMDNEFRSGTDIRVSVMALKDEEMPSGAGARVSGPQSSLR